MDYPNYLKPVKRLKGQAEIKKWVRNNYYRMDSGGIDRLGGEPNTTPYSEEAWENSPANILITRWSDYFSVDVSFTHGMVNQMMKEFLPGAFIDLNFFPNSPKDFEMLKSDRVPIMFGSASKRPFADFDLVSISHCVTNEGLNWPAMLKYSGIPLWKHERMDREDLPLIIMGGANAFCNESLYGGWSLEDDENVCMIDAVFVGEGEKIFPKLLKIYAECKAAGMTKRDILKEFHVRKIPGYYEPDQYEHVYGKPEWHGKFGTCDYLLEINPKEDWVRPIVKKAKVMDLDSVRSIEEDILPYTGAGEAQCAIAAGCNCACSFCQEAAVNVPYRERSAEAIIAAIMKARVNQGASTASWFAFNWNTHSQIHTITRAAMHELGDVGLISMRIDTLAEHEGLATLLKFVGNKSQTMGVEGASQRLRDFLHKSVSTHDLINGAEYLIKNNCSEMKFFMIATGQEEDDDIQEWIGVMRQINELKKKYNSKCQTRVSFMPVYNCAFTALQFYRCESYYKIKEDTLRPLVEACRELKWGFRTGSRRSEIMISQLNEMADRRTTPLLVYNSLGDPEMLKEGKDMKEKANRALENFILDHDKTEPDYRDVLRAHKDAVTFAEAKIKYSSGWIFTGLIPKNVDAIWKERMERMGLDLDYYFCEKDMDYIFPWDIIDISVTKEYTFEKWIQAKAFFDPGYCVGTLTKSGKCFSCAGCPTPSHTAWMTQREVDAPFTRENLEAYKRDMTKRGVVRFKLQIDNPLMRTARKKFFGRSLARAMMMANPEKWSPIFMDQTGNSRTTASTNDQKDWVYGRILIDFSFNKQVSTEMIREDIEAINKRLHGYRLLDAKGYAGSEVKTLFSSVDNALYKLFIPNEGIPFKKINDRIMAYNKKRASGGDFQIKKKELKMKGAFRTVMKDLDVSRIKYVGCRQGMDKGKIGTELIMLSDNKINPFDLLESLLGGKAFQYRKYETEILGYYKDGSLQVVDLFAEDDDSSTTYACENSGEPIELEVFSGEPYKSKSAKDLCIAADFSVALESDIEIVVEEELTEEELYELPTT